MRYIGGGGYPLLAQNRKLQRSPNRNVIRIGKVIRLGDLRILVGVAIKQQADRRKRVTRLDSHWLSLPAACPDLMLQVGVRGVNLLDRVPHTVSHDGGGDTAFDMDLLAGEVNRLKRRTVRNETL